MRETCEEKESKQTDVSATAGESRESRRTLKVTTLRGLRALQDLRVQQGRHHFAPRTSRNFTCRVSTPVRAFAEALRSCWVFRPHALDSKTASTPIDDHFCLCGAHQESGSPACFNAFCSAKLRKDFLQRMMLAI